MLAANMKSEGGKAEQAREAEQIKAKEAEEEAQLMSLKVDFTKANMKKKMLKRGIPEEQTAYCEIGEGEVFGVEEIVSHS